MKKFTEKEINMLLDFIKDGILETYVVLDNNNVIDEIAKILCKYSPENIIKQLDFKKLADFIDNVYINDRVFKNEVIPFAKDLNKIIKERIYLSPAESLGLLHMGVDRKTLASMLGLRERATKEDIINEINNIL